MPPFDFWTWSAAITGRHCLCMPTVRAIQYVICDRCCSVTHLAGEKNVPLPGIADRNWTGNATPGNRCAHSVPGSVARGKRGWRRGSGTRPGPRGGVEQPLRVDRPGWRAGTSGGACLRPRGRRHAGCWWRRGEANPRPQALDFRLYVRSPLFGSRAALPEGQGRRSASGR